jgi:opacity protein-like surface antigen
MSDQVKTQVCSLESGKSSQEACMHTKRVLLASSALALLAGATNAQAGELYISVFGGANWVEDSSAAATFTSTGATDYTIVESWNLDSDTGFVLGGTVGTHLDKWLKGLRVELEASYRRHDVNGAFAATLYSTGTTASLSTTGEFITGNLSTFALLANVWYEHDMGWKVRPYVGGGVGWARTKFDAVADGGEGFLTTVDRSNDGFAWQLGVGFNYEAAPGVDVGLGYRYFQGPDINRTFEFDPFSGKGNPEAFGRLNNDNHSVLVNLNIDIN